MAIDISKLAQESVGASAFERSVLDQLMLAVGFDAAFFFVKGQEATVTTVGLDADTAARLVAKRETYGQELSRVMKVALSGRGVAVDTEVCGVQHVQTRVSPFGQHLFGELCRCFLGGCAIDVSY